MVQSRARASVPVDIHGRAVGAGDALQPDQSAAPTGKGLVWNPTVVVRASHSSAAPLPPPTEATGYEFMKRSSSGIHAVKGDADGARTVFLSDGYRTNSS